MTRSVIPVQKPPLAVRAFHTDAQRGEKLALLPLRRNCFVRRFCVGSNGERVQMEALYLTLVSTPL